LTRYTCLVYSWNVLGLTRRVPRSMSPSSPPTACAADDAMTQDVDAVCVYVALPHLPLHCMHSLHSPVLACARVVRLASHHTLVTEIYIYMHARAICVGPKPTTLVVPTLLGTSLSPQIWTITYQLGGFALPPLRAPEQISRAPRPRLPARLGACLGGLGTPFILHIGLTPFHTLQLATGHLLPLR